MYMCPDVIEGVYYSLEMILTPSDFAVFLCKFSGLFPSSQIWIAMGLMVRTLNLSLPFDFHAFLLIDSSKLAFEICTL